MKEKELFVVPEVEVVKFAEQDIVTTSGIGGNSTVQGPGIGLPDDEW